MATAILLIWIFSALTIILGIYWASNMDSFDLFGFILIIACIWLIWTSALVYQGANPWLKSSFGDPQEKSLTIEKQ